METTRLSTKGQIVLPKSIRESRAWTAGTEFTVEETADGLLIKPVQVLPAVTLEQVAGCLKTGRKKPVTLAEMDAAITARIHKRHALGRY